MVNQAIFTLPRSKIVSSGLEAILNYFENELSFDW